MSVIGSSILAGASGSAGGDPVYVDDVFSTYLYDGIGVEEQASAKKTIVNGIDLAGEGGLVWTKRRDGTAYNVLVDTERGPTNGLFSNATNAQHAEATLYMSSFNNNGFTSGRAGSVSSSGRDFASWTFRKAPGFFDVVTFQTPSNGGPFTVPHNLGSVPGMILTKNLDVTENWNGYHRSLGNNQNVYLDATDAAGSTTVWNNTNPTDSVFTFNKGSGNLGQNYVAYVFAHDDAQFGTGGDESIIKCGTYTGNAGTNPINLGFEAQWILIKQSGNSGDWSIIDVTREANMNQTSYVFANESNSESSTSNPTILAPSPTGFTLYRNDAATNRSGRTYVYMAIRRPHKPPEAATEVFAIDTSEGTAPTPPQFTSGFVTDLALRKTMTSGNSVIGSRLQGTNYMNTANDGAESGASVLTWDFSDGWSNAVSDPPNADMFAYMFKRAPGFMDVVAYTGTGSARTVNHNLTVVPEMMIVKKRSSAANWQVYHSSQGNTKYSPSFRTDPFYTSSDRWNSTTPTSTQFSVGTDTDINQSTSTYIAYLFATLSGISKVGSYSGTGNVINVDCGFTNGARFILIKRTDAEIQGTGGTNWYVWDTLRGIVSGNDPYFILNNSAAQVTNTDYIDPLGTGFTVTSSAPAALNTSGGTYIFLAIA